MQRGFAPGVQLVAVADQDYVFLGKVVGLRPDALPVGVNQLQDFRTGGRSLLRVENLKPLVDGLFDIYDFLFQSARSSASGVIGFYGFAQFIQKARHGAPRKE